MLTTRIPNTIFDPLPALHASILDHSRVTVSLGYWSAKHGPAGSWVMPMCGGAFPGRPHAILPNDASIIRHGGGPDAMSETFTMPARTYRALRLDLLSQLPDWWDLERRCGVRAEVIMQEIS